MSQQSYANPASQLAAQDGARNSVDHTELRLLGGYCIGFTGGGIAFHTWGL